MQREKMKTKIWVKRNRARGKMEHHFFLQRMNLFIKRRTGEKEIPFSFRSTVFLFIILSISGEL